MTVGSQEPAIDVELCYKSQAYLYDGTLWACTIPGENDEEKFRSNEYLKKKNNAQCSNSPVNTVKIVVSH